MWKRLGLTGQEGSRIIRRFEEEGVIKRQRELREGRWTYRLYHLRRPVNLDSLGDCPLHGLQRHRQMHPRGARHEP